MVDSAIFSRGFSYEYNIMPTMPVDSFDLNDTSLTTYTGRVKNTIFSFAHSCVINAPMTILEISRDRGYRYTSPYSISK